MVNVVIISLLLTKEVSQKDCIWDCHCSSLEK